VGTSIQHNPSTDDISILLRLVKQAKRVKGVSTLQYSPEVFLPDVTSHDQESDEGSSCFYLDVLPNEHDLNQQPLNQIEARLVQNMTPANSGSERQST